MSRILIVEDELIVARDIGQQLVLLGHQAVGTASRGEQAIAMTAELAPDLVLMDVQLAGSMDGIDAAEAIRTRYAVPVVFLTAFATDETLSRAKRVEPYGYILKPFSERELRTVLEMALYKHAAEARLRQNALQLKALSQRILEVQEIERRRVAQELHEELAQALTAIKINLQAPASVAGASPALRQADNLRIVDDALNRVRQMAMALRPSMLDDFGLEPALRWLAQQASMQGGFIARLRVPKALERQSQQIETVCFRIAQEALSNAVRHSRASQVHVYLYGDAETLYLGVKDNGVGLQVREFNGLGLLGMHERATLVGGRLDIHSARGGGCTVRFRCPMLLRQ